MNRLETLLRPWWNRLSSRERIIAGSCAAVLAVALFSQGIAGPILSYLDGLQTQIETRQIKLIKYHRWMVSKEAGSGTVQDLAAAKTSGAENEDMSRFLKEIEQMAQESGTRIVDVKPLPPEQKGIQERLGIDLQLEASLAPLARYLYKIQASDRLLEVNRFQLSTGDGPSLHASLLVTQTLFLAEPVRAPARRLPVSPSQ